MAVTIKNVIHKLHECNRHAAGAVAGAAIRGSSSSSSHCHLHSAKNHLSIRNFTYRDARWEKLFFESLRSVNFSGVTVRTTPPPCPPPRTSIEQSCHVPPFSASISSLFLFLGGFTGV